MFWFTLPQERAELLIEKVTDAGPDAYKHFREALGPNYQHIVIKLDATPMDAGNFHRGKQQRKSRKSVG